MQYDSLEAPNHGTLARAGAAPPSSHGIIEQPENVLSGAPVPVVAAAVGVASQSGECIWSYDRVFYYNYFISPFEADAGVVTADKQIAVSIWSAWPDSHDLNTIDTGPGVSVDLTLPRTFRALENVATQYLISKSGPPRINVSVRANFDNGVGLGKVIGLRAVQWPFKHNWVATADESITFSTVIHQADRGREQRRALWAAPIRTVSRLVDAWDGEEQELWRILDNYHDVAVSVPEWPKWLAVKDPAAVAATEVVFTDPGEDLRWWLIEGVYLTFGRPGERPRQLVAVTNVDLSVSGEVKVTIDTPLTEALDDSWRAYRTVVGYHGTTLSAGAHTYGVARAKISVRSQPGVQPEPPEISPPLFDGLPIFLHKFDWAAPPKMNYASFRKDIPMGENMAIYTPAGWSARILVASWNQLSKKDVFDIERFFIAMRGRAKTFWFPSSVKNMMPMQDLLSGTATVLVEGTETYEAYRDSPVHPAILVRMKDGSTHPNKVLSITKITDSSGTNTAITVVEPWSSDLLLADMAGVEWLSKARFGSDEVRIAWMSESYARITLSVRIVEE